MLSVIVYQCAKSPRPNSTKLTAHSNSYNLYGPEGRELLASEIERNTGRISLMKFPINNSYLLNFLNSLSSFLVLSCAAVLSA